MEQIERIKYYEKIMNKAVSALKNLDKALDAYIKAQVKIEELERYYTSAERILKDE